MNNMKIISTGAADILLVLLPEDCVSPEINDLYNNEYHLWFWEPDSEGKPFRWHKDAAIKLPEGYNYTILGRASDIDENKAKDLMPLIKRIYGASYYDYMSPDKNNSFYYAMDALQSFKSFLKSQGILLENPYNPPIERLQYGGGYAMRQAEIEEYEEAQSKVKNPLIIKAEKI